MATKGEIDFLPVPGVPVIPTSPPNFDLGVGRSGLLCGRRYLELGFPVVPELREFRRYDRPAVWL